MWQFVLLFPVADCILAPRLPLDLSHKAVQWLQKSQHPTAATWKFPGAPDAKASCWRERLHKRMLDSWCVKNTPKVCNSFFTLWLLPSGFHKLKEFIITQHPLESTVMDFWQMVWDHNAQTIVMLSDIDNTIDQVKVSPFIVKLNFEPKQLLFNNINIFYCCNSRLIVVDEFHLNVIFCTI